MKAIYRPRATKMRAASAILICSIAALSTAQSGYRIGEDGASADAGPVRMARFDLLKGSVQWRATASMEWSSATRNLPIREGAQVYAPDNSRGEVQFDDGSDMRLAAGAVATLVTLYSDSKGEFTEIKLNNGLATFHLVNKNSLYQIDTPTGSIKSYGPAEIRVGDTSGVEIAVRTGQAVLDSSQGSCTMEHGQYLNMATAQSQPVLRPIPAPDQWDTFNEERDQQVYQSSQYVPSNIGLVSGDINSYGSWRDDQNYGHVWCPRESADWRPYRDGHWVFNGPYGWTWVGDEDWGWAPYHYGTWVHESYGWGWCPGPAAQCWSPAVVNFCSYGGNVAWCPLAPAEVHYGVGLSLGFQVGGLLLGFSIGRAACYYPTAGGYCEPRPWSNVYVNRQNNFYNVTNINNYYGRSGLNSSWGNHNFVPRNTRFGGGSYVAEGSFGRVNHGYHALAPGQASFFSKGKSFGMPGRGAGQISGPLNVHPVAASFTPTHTYSGHGPSQAILNRSVYRSPVPTYAARSSTSVGHTLVPPHRTLSVRNAAIGAGAAGLAAHAAANHFATARSKAMGRDERAAAAARTGVPGGHGSFSKAPARSKAEAHSGSFGHKATPAEVNHEARLRAKTTAHTEAARAHTEAARSHTEAARAHNDAAKAHNEAARSHAVERHVEQTHRATTPTHREAPHVNRAAAHARAARPAARRSSVNRQRANRPQRSNTSRRSTFQRQQPQRRQQAQRQQPQRRQQRQQPQRQQQRQQPQRQQRQQQRQQPQRQQQRQQPQRQQQRQQPQHQQQKGGGGNRRH
jgi:hypothetical protein